MMGKETREKVRDFVLKYVKDEELADDENMFDLGYVNSLFAMQLVMFVEKEFHLTLSRDSIRLTNFQSIDAIIALIASQRQVA